MKELYKQTEEKMQKAIVSLETEFASIRAGRATSAVLDSARKEGFPSMEPK